MKTIIITPISVQIVFIVVIFGNFSLYSTSLDPTKIIFTAFLHMEVRFCNDLRAETYMPVFYEVYGRVDRWRHILLNKNNR